jgi:hypothetical protein
LGGKGVADAALPLTARARGANDREEAFTATTFSVRYSAEGDVGLIDVYR